LRAAAPLLVCLAVLWLYAAALGDRAFQTHEALDPYARTQELVNELRAGRWPQVLPDAAGGAGSAFPRHYPPVAYASAAALAAVTGDAVRGTNAAFLAALLASALAAYVLVLKVARDPLLAACGALVAVSAPYRFAQVFVRGALAEAWSLAFVPVVLLGLWRATERGRPGLALPLGLSGLLLAHQVTLPFALPLFVLAAAPALSRHGRTTLRALALGVALALGLAAFFLLPQRAGIERLRVADPALVGATAEAVSAQRLAPFQLVELPRADAWFGLARSEPEPDGMSFALGWAPLVGLLLAALALVRQAGDARVRSLLAALALSSLLLLAFACAPGPFLAVLPDGVAYVQFPWRVLGLAGLCASLALPLALHVLLPGPRARAAAAVVGVLAVASVPGFERRPLTRPEWTAGFLSRDFLAATGGRGYTVQAEYLPRGYEPGMPLPAPSVSSGRVLGLQRDGAAVCVRLDAPQAATLTLPLFAFDFQRARDAAGRALDVGAAGPWLTLALPPGTAQVRVAPETVPAARAGLGLSVLAAAGLLATAFRRPLA
jgi:hypothetical protein